MKDDLITQTIKPEYPTGAPFWLVASANEMLDWLEKWHSDGCPTLKTMPRREAAGKRVEDFDRRNRMYQAAYRKLDKKK